MASKFRMWKHGLNESRTDPASVLRSGAVSNFPLGKTHLNGSPTRKLLLENFSESADTHLQATSFQHGGARSER